MLRSTRWPLVPALALLTLTLAACGQSNPTATSSDPVLSSTQASVTLRLPAPQSLSAQYINQSKTTRLDVSIDGTPATSYTLGSVTAPCANGFCTVTLLNVPSGSHSFTFGTYGVKPADGTTVLISQGSLTATLLAGQVNTFALTLTPVGVTFSLSSAVKQYNATSKTFGNYVKFTTFAGRSLPAYYDVQGSDSVGDSIPTVVCGDAGTAITTISDSTHPNRFRVEVQTLGSHTLSVQAGSTCTTGGTALITQTVTGSAAGGSGLSTESRSSAAILSDRTIRTWGYGRYGSMGNGTTTTSNPTVQTPTGLNNVAALAGGGTFHLALLNDGTVKAWGYDRYGLLGDGTTTSRSTPAPVPGLGNVVSLSAGDDHSFALLNDGKVKAWGDNYYGQLGDGTTTARSTPTPIPDLKDVVSLAGGGGHSLALLADGTVKAWGWNLYGQLGDGTTTNRTTPTPIPGLGNVVSLSAGSSHNLALLNDGTVKAWGNNSDGQLGDGSTDQRITPTLISGLGNVVSVNAGVTHSLALLNDGTVKAWGNNITGQLGDGTTTSRSTPTSIPGLGNVASVAGGYLHSLALLADGTVKAWGYNSDGELGDGTTTPHTTPVTVVGLSGVVQPTP